MTDRTLTRILESILIVNVVGLAILACYRPEAQLVLLMTAPAVFCLFLTRTRR